MSRAENRHCDLHLQTRVGNGDVCLNGHINNETQFSKCKTSHMPVDGIQMVNGCQIQNDISCEQNGAVYILGEDVSNAHKTRPAEVHETSDLFQDEILNELAKSSSANTERVMSIHENHLESRSLNDQHVSEMSECFRAEAVVSLDETTNISISNVGSSQFSSYSQVSAGSMHYLKKKFAEVQIEDIYQKYSLRLQRSLVICLLVVLLLYAVVLLVLFHTLNEGELGLSHIPNPYIGMNITVIIGGALSIIGLVLVSIKQVYTRFHKLITIIVWLSLIGTTIAFNVSLTPKGPSGVEMLRTSMDDVPMVIYLIFVLHTMLPMSRRWSTGLGVLTAVISLIYSGVMYKDSVAGKIKSYDLLVNQILANFVIFLGVNLIGLYHKHLTDIAHRHTFLDTRNFIETGMRLNRQRSLQEKLLLKIIPGYLLDDMKSVLNRKLLLESHERDEEADFECQDEFHDLLVKHHEGVSILYADIVNFTPLTTQLQPSDLVIALNELFGRFDQLAKDNHCTRIKILGDCYYCVSGLPEPNPQHARNCVITGLQMIDVIREIRDQTCMQDLDMRIGVHTGTVLSGVLGLRKWQYDVWSDDVTLANHMESTGEAGKVHVTETTLRLLGNEFQYSEGPVYTGSGEHEGLEIKTYFILPDPNEEIIPISPEITRRRATRPKLMRSQSVVEVVGDWGAEKPFSSLSDHMMARTQRSSSKSGGLSPEQEEINRQLVQGFHLQEEGMAKARDLSTDSQINPILLVFKNGKTELQYTLQRDNLFRFNVACACLIYVVIALAQMIALPMKKTFYIVYSVGFVVFGLLLFFTLRNDKANHFFKVLLNLCQVSLREKQKKQMYKIIRTFIAGTSLGAIFASAFVTVIDCDRTNSTSNHTISPTEEEGSGVCWLATYYVYFCMLCLMACSVFLRMYFLVKVFFMVICLLVYNLMFYDEILYRYVFEAYNQTVGNNDLWRLEIRGSVYLGVLFLTLIVHDRQIENSLRLDFLWKKKIRDEKDEVARNDLLNTLLLENILPKHVADHFITSQKSKELYHQSYNSVCVMFASIPDYKEFYEETEANQNGIGCLRLLNEIIAVFDKLLSRSQFNDVEKIKTIGSTYMAAAGLRPNRDMDLTQASLREDHNIVTMVKFAFAMMDRLATLNPDMSINTFEYNLRIGIAHGGPVIAGVIGAQKPQYDIWGDTVNIASRMETNGVIGKIQVPESTADVLRKNGIPCEFRTQTYIKGKGMMDLFTVSHTKLMSQGSFYSTTSAKS